MKLSLDQIAQVAQQTGANPIPEDAPFFTALKEGFGDHTFYDGKGLHVFAPAGEAKDGGQPIQVMMVASWKDAEHTSFTPQDPKPGKTKATLRLEE